MMVRARTAEQAVGLAGRRAKPRRGRGRLAFAGLGLVLVGLAPPVAGATLKAVLGQILSGRHERLGDAVLAAQRDYADSGAFPELLSIYHLFGDPAMGIR